MPGSTDFSLAMANLTSDVVAQGSRVQRQLELAFDALFHRDRSKAAEAAKLDDEIDRVDVEIERSAVSLLTEMASSPTPVTQEQIRWILTLVKVNNELERIADVGVEVTEFVDPAVTTAFPDTFRIMAHSVIGILRDVNASFSRKDPRLAKMVLQSQHAVNRFKIQVVKDAESKIAANVMSVDFGFTVHEIASLCETIADHCTNMSEQIIYAQTGAIVRHMESCWVEVGDKKL
jgi:phosphate transport system protein